MIAKLIQLSLRHKLLVVLGFVAVSAAGVFSLLMIAAIRELLGFGTLFGITVLGNWWTPWVVMILPPGAFFVLGLYIWLLRSIFKEAN